MSTSIIFLALIIIVCFLLVVVIMVQNPKGAGLSSTFGGGGGGQMGGVQKTNDFLEKSTWTLATVLLILILLFNATVSGGSKEQGSHLDGIENTAPASQQNATDQNQDATKTVDPNAIDANQQNDSDQ